eukprot:171793-Hanusia_phi.AAC.1
MIGLPGPRPRAPGPGESDPTGPGSPGAAPRRRRCTNGPTRDQAAGATGGGTRAAMPNRRHI